uniref:Transposase n=1 Tax=Heterorhabditis bacteriophora TaxID=37862 RepID=A0A1I7WM27_HETBA
MAVYLFVELDSINSLPDIMNILLCGHWITAKNVRAHVATHLTIRSQGFDRMNRAIVHLERMHAGDSDARIESAV